MNQRSANAVLTTVIAFAVAALVFLPDWLGTMNQFARIVQYEIYGR